MSGQVNGQIYYRAVGRQLACFVLVNTSVKAGQLAEIVSRGRMPPQAARGRQTTGQQEARQDMGGTNALDVLAVKTRVREKADREWREAVLIAHLDGFTNRDIAEAAGLTHEGVRGIIKKAGL